MLLITIFIALVFDFLNGFHDAAKLHVVDAAEAHDLGA